MSLFWELYQHRQIADAAGSAARSSSQAQRAERTAEDAAKRVDRLALVCMAMWSLLQERTGVTEAELMARMQELDLADGVADGKVTPQATRCPSCERLMSPKHRRCLYCGTPTPADTAFDNLR